VRYILWSLVVLAMVGLVVAKVVLPKRQVPATGVDASLFNVPPITLTDQDDRTFSTAQLLGHPWVADFIFTSCAGTCPIMTHQMAEVQKNTPGSVDLVSFTVDPEHDTPAILKEYGQGNHADFSRWHFLTGTKQQMAEAAYAMKISVRPADKDYALTHSEKLLLINRFGDVVGIYDGTSPQDVARLTADAAKLVASGDGRKSS
jgi:protein SCO1/2